MKLYMVVDIILLAILIWVVARGWRNGLVSSVIRLVGAVASYAGAWIVSELISQALYKSFLQAKLVDYAETLVPPELQTISDSFAKLGGNTDLLEKLGIDLPRAIAEQLEAVMEQLGLSGLPERLVDTGKLGGEITESVLDNGSTIAEALAQSLFQPLATTALRVVAFAIIFALLSIVVSLLYRIGFGFNHIPLIGGVNHLLGAGVGLLEGVIIVYILCMVLAIASAVLGGKVELLNWQQLQNTAIFSKIVGITLPGGFGIL